MRLKIGEYPHDPEQAGTYKRNDHRRDRIAESPYRTDENIHDTAGEIRYADPAHPYKAVTYHFRIGIIYPQKRRTAEICQISEDETGSDDTQLTKKEDMRYALHTVRTVVLACE